MFTHGDLQPKNILIKRKAFSSSEGEEDGHKSSSEIEIKIIDWEISGWYPDYSQFCNYTVASRFRPDWLELVQQIMHVRVPEYLMLQIIRSLLFY